MIDQIRQQKQQNQSKGVFINMDEEAHKEIKEGFSIRQEVVKSKMTTKLDELGLQTLVESKKKKLSKREREYQEVISLA